MGKTNKQTNKNRKWLDLALLLFCFLNNHNLNWHEIQPKQNVKKTGQKQKDVIISWGMTFKFWQKRRKELKRRHCIFNISILTDSFSCSRSCLTHGDIQFINDTSPSLPFYAPLSVPLTDTDRYTHRQTRARTQTHASKHLYSRHVVSLPFRTLPRAVFADTHNRKSSTLGNDENAPTATRNATDLLKRELLRFCWQLVHIHDTGRRQWHWP